MSLSFADIKGAGAGFISLVWIFIMIAVMSLVFEEMGEWIGQAAEKYAVVYAIMMMAIAFNSVVAVGLFVFGKCFQQLR